MHVYRDNEPVQGRIRQRLQPLTKHSHVISAKNLIRDFWRCPRYVRWVSLLHFRGNQRSMSQDPLATLKTEVLEQAGLISKAQQNNIIHAKKLNTSLAFKIPQ